MAAADEENMALRYSLVLTIKHPTIEPATISEALGLSPTRSWTAGEPRTTPAGTVLPGVNPASFWSLSEARTGHREFFAAALDMVQNLERSVDFLSHLTDSGGIISIVVQLPGKVNIGDQIAPGELMRIARLGIFLGVEVFPDFT